MFSVRSLESFLSNSRVRERQKGKSLVVDSVTGFSRRVEALDDGSFTCTFSLPGVKLVKFTSDAECCVYSDTLTPTQGIVAETSEQLKVFLLDNLAFPSSVRSNSRLLDHLVNLIDQHAWVIFNHSDIEFGEADTVGIGCYVTVE